MRFKIFYFFLLKSVYLQCIVEIDGIAYPLLFGDYKTTGAIPVFFNSVFLFAVFFCKFLSQTDEDPIFLKNSGAAMTFQEAAAKH